MGLIAVELDVVDDFVGAGVVVVAAFGMSVDFFVESALTVLLESGDFFGSTDLELSDFVSEIMLFFESLDDVLCALAGVDVAGSAAAIVIGVVEGPTGGVCVLLGEETVAFFEAAAALKAAMRASSAISVKLTNRLKLPAVRAAR